MTHRLAAALLSTALLTAGTAVIAPATHADSPGCVTRKEFRKVGEGMGMKKVHAVFDTAGRRVAKDSQDGLTIETRRYSTCSGDGGVGVLFRNGRLSSKSGSF
ncbi:hypothetical protein [Nocardioides sp. Leaf307]|uniref:hypothetical protein n=1 Tax=Nocardioides sp. Leaf307 TaxID=1736331 RepID=UPI000702E5B1|nr:hypothetical protein [Nocardioides sp. Leaf307]KQQ39762.1 hypothetical protein ASF50_18090 [Nocardioides sp. Leaf307]